MERSPTDGGDASTRYFPPPLLLILLHSFPCLYMLCLQNKKTKLHGLSLWANYNDRATVACRRIQCQLLQIEGATWSVWRIPYGRILGFLDRSHYFFFQVAPQLYSQGWVGPVPDPLLLRKSGSTGNRPWTSGSVARNKAIVTNEGYCMAFMTYIRGITMVKTI
jgi:hypothetical protein